MKEYIQHSLLQQNQQGTKFKTKVTCEGIEPYFYKELYPIIPQVLYPITLHTNPPLAPQN